MAARTARKALTQLKVDKLRPDPKRRLEVPDHLLPALRLIIQTSGSRSWAVRTRLGTKPVKLTLPPGLDLKAAREAAREVLIKVAAGDDPRAGKRRQRRAQTLGAVAEAYLKHTADQVRPRTQIERARHLRRDWAPLHDRPLAEIGRAEIAGLLLQLKDERGGVAANRARSTLHACFGWGIDLGLTEANPVASTRPPMAKERARDRVLSLAELRRIWEAAGDGDYGDIVRLLILLGARRAEAAGARWSEIDLAGRRWLISADRTKNNRSLEIVLPDQALAIFEGRERQPDRDLVFGDGNGPFSGWSRSKARLDRRCGVSDWVLHDLRRSFVTHLIELGVPAEVVEQCVNHASGLRAGVAGVYNRAKHRDATARAWALWAATLTEAPSEKVVVAFSRPA